MKSKKRIKKLEAEIALLKKVVKSDSITLTDESSPNVNVVMSLKNGVFSTDKITTTEKETIDNITKDQNS